MSAICVVRRSGTVQDVGHVGKVQRKSLLYVRATDLYLYIHKFLKKAALCGPTALSRLHDEQESHDITANVGQNVYKLQLAYHPSSSNQGAHPGNMNITNNPFISNHILFHNKAHFSLHV